MKAINQNEWPASFLRLVHDCKSTRHLSVYYYFIFLLLHNFDSRLLLSTSHTLLHSCANFRRIAFWAYFRPTSFSKITWGTGPKIKKMT
ncbi:hypothetical protein DM01DRAFT_97604 [Hesseltinella vesiculosa]|uniref:Uncharacterized protein n=1 Tax=Hesseltinella vesiculosa TaxID=101127 RepID=A0A1X2G360_9FUNG|nr:hypothetical protein DM01DRAFT_97604 [Hesseltinella vesiculosa]